MRVKTYLEKTMVELKAYKEKIDSIIPVYWAEINAHEVYLENMEGKYTPEYIAEERGKWKPKTDYSGIINAEREKRKASGNNGFRNITRETIDKTSGSLFQTLYRGYGEGLVDRQDIARYLRIDQKHISNILREVSQWSN